MHLDTAQATRAAFFARLLARLYRDPPEAALLAELAGLDLAEAWPFAPGDPGAGYGFAALGAALADPDRAKLSRELTAEHLRLFVGPGMPLVPLWGSVYLDEENLLLGESTLQLEAFLARAGLAPNLENREPLDHLGLLLWALGALLERQAAGRAAPEDCAGPLRELLQAHLSPWTPRCLELLAEKAESPFYHGLGELTAALLQGLAAACDAGQVEQLLYY